MRWAKLVSILSIIVFIFFSCKKNNYPIEPNINFIGLSPDVVSEGQDQIIQVAFSFSDGDGDIGYNVADSTQNIYFSDSRYDSVTLRFQFPEITEDNNPEQGIKGDFAVDVNAAFLLKRTDTIHENFDTIVWDVYVIDQAGHKSNVVQTSPLTLTK